MIDAATFHQCLALGTCYGLSPLQYADEQSECVIRQYFGENGPPYPTDAIFKRKFLLYAGTDLFYTLLSPITLRIECQDPKLSGVSTILGRGTIKIPRGCSINTNKAFFSKTNMQRVVLRSNHSLGKTISIKHAPPSNRRMTNLGVDFINAARMSPPFATEKNAYIWLIVAPLAGVSTLAILIALAAVWLFFSRQRATRV